MKQYDSNIYLAFNYLQLFIILILVAIIMTGVTSIDLLPFIGAIIGGVLTLSGVRYTIKSSSDSLILSLKKQEERSFLESIGEKYSNIKTIKRLVHDMDRQYTNWNLGLNDELELTKKRDQETAQKVLRFILEQFNEITIKSSNVDWLFFNEIKKFVDFGFSNIFNTVDNLDAIGGYLDKILIKALDDHEKRLMGKFEEYFNSNSYEN